MPSGVPDRWDEGLAYERFMGRWSRALAPRFVSWLGLPTGLRWLDVGCGTGALTAAICGCADPESVLGCDPAAALLEQAGRTVGDARASFLAAGVGSLPRHPRGYGCAASLLALNFFPDAGAAIDEQQSLVIAGGTVAACVWDYAAGMQFLRRFWDAAAAGDPAARDLDEEKRFPLCNPGNLRALFNAAGLRNVRCEALEIPTVFTGFDDYWRPFLGATGPAPSYVTTLGAGRAAALAARLERTLPKGPDGAIPLVAQGWAVRGTVA